MEEELDIILSLGECRCSRCDIYLPEGTGIMLKTCLHPFCRACLVEVIMQQSTEYQVKCPYPGDDDTQHYLGAASTLHTGCDSNGYITLKEIHSVLSTEELQQYFENSGHKAEMSAVNMNNDQFFGAPAPVQTFSKKSNIKFVDPNSSRYHIMLSDVPSICTYCAEDLPVGSGIHLQICHHVFCRNCLQDAIISTNSIKINCLMGVPECNGYLLDSEIKQIVSEEIFEQYLEKCMKYAENKMSNIFRCKSRGCTGICEVDENTRRVFFCPRCKYRNCILCKAIHEEVTCEKFQEILAEGYTLAQASELVKNELKTGWDQLYTYVRRPESARGSYENVLVEQEQNVPSYSSILEKIERSNILPSTKKFGCTICIEDTQPGEGIVLRDCLHTFCQPCIIEYISKSEDPTVQCPFRDEENNPCTSFIASREIKALLPTNVYEEYLARSINRAELVIENSFHCLTPNCTGWCEAEETARFFWCPICERENCIRCKVFHEESTCEQYKQQIEDDENRKVQAQNETLGEAVVLASIEKLEFQRCPKCKSVCHKIDGCAHVTCAACKTPFNWR